MWSRKRTQSHTASLEFRGSSPCFSPQSNQMGQREWRDSEALTREGHRIRGWALGVNAATRRGQFNPPPPPSGRKECGGDHGGVYSPNNKPELMINKNRAERMKGDTKEGTGKRRGRVLQGKDAPSLIWSPFPPTEIIPTAAWTTQLPKTPYWPLFTQGLSAWG